MMHKAEATTSTSEQTKITHRFCDDVSLIFCSNFVKLFLKRMLSLKSQRTSSVLEVNFSVDRGGDLLVKIEIKRAGVLTDHMLPMS